MLVERTDTYRSTENGAGCSILAHPDEHTTNRVVIQRSQSGDSSNRQYESKEAVSPR